MCRQVLERRRAPLLLSCPPKSPVVPLLTFAQSSGPARELPRHSGGFHVCSGGATPIIWHSPAGPKQRLLTKKMRLDQKEMAFESSPGSVREWQQRELPGHGRAARRRSRGSGIPSPRAARFSRRGRQLRASEEDDARQDTIVRDKILEGYGWPDDHHIATGRSAIFDP
jgi:hypothetical protein